MKPVKFKECNITFGKDQPGYQPLPALKIKGDERGQVTTLYQLTLVERLIVLLTGKVFFTVWTFDSKLQPQRPHLALREVVKFD